MPKRITECTKVLFENGKRVFDNGSLKDRRDRVLKATSQFGGLKGLILDEEKYPVYMSIAVYNKFIQKYTELFIQKEQ